MSQDKLLGSLFKENQVGEGRKGKKSLSYRGEWICAEDFPKHSSSFWRGREEGRGATRGRQKYKCRFQGIPKAQGSRYSRFLSWIKKFSEAKGGKIYQVVKSFPHPNPQMQMSNIMHIINFLHKTNKHLILQNRWSSCRCVCLFACV